MTPTPVIAQSDLVTAYGQGIAPLWAGLLKNQTAITTSTRFANRGFTSNQIAQIPDLETKPNQSRARAMLDRLLKPLERKLDPNTTLILATTVCEIEFIERAITENNPDLAENAQPQFLLAHLKELLGLTAQALVLSSACASSSAAIAHAATLIQQKKSNAVLVIACDSISDFVYSGFSTLMSLCDTPARPFDLHRCGLTLGEAAAWALITPHDSPLADKNSPAILGHASTTDAIHMTAPDRTATGLSRAIRSAFNMADIESNKINFIAAHGTATIYNDAMELTAFHKLLHTPIPTFSIKGAIGHSLGAAGLTQILTVAHALKQKLVPPTVGFTTPDPQATDWVHSTAIPLKSQSVALSTNSGFGGVNTALILGSLSHVPVAEGRGEGDFEAQTSPDEQRKIRTTNIERPTSNVEVKSEDGLCSTLDVGRSMFDVRMNSVSIAWSTPQHCGFLNQTGPHPLPTNPKEITDLIGRPTKYLARMTPETRAALIAASLALQTTNWNPTEQTIAILGTGYKGCIRADLNYYQDFTTAGLSLGRANLFIYTLPTSALSEVAIALNLTGTTQHLHHDTNPLQALIESAQQNNGPTLAVLTDENSAICFAIGQGAELKLPDFPWSATATEIANHLQSTP